mgnify:CR=1 FL=1
MILIVIIINKKNNYNNNKLRQWVEKVGVRVRIGLMQKTMLLGSNRILREGLAFKLPGGCPQRTLGYLL